MKIKVNIDLRVSRIVKYFILCDLFMSVGWGFVAPVFSVFVIDRVAGANLITVGISVAIYFTLKSILQLPVANFLDRRAGEKDDFRLMIAGLLLISASAFFFTLVTKIWQLYLVQIIHAVSFALYVPAWSGIFSRHLDKERMSFDWSLDSTAIGLSTGIGGLLGGIVASFFGFNMVFIFAALFSMVAALVLTAAPDLILPPKTTAPSLPIKDHNPTAAGH